LKKRKPKNGIYSGMLNSAWEDLPKRNSSPLCSM